MNKISVEDEIFKNKTKKYLIGKKIHNNKYKKWNHQKSKPMTFV